MKPLSKYLKLVAFIIIIFHFSLGCSKDSINEDIIDFGKSTYVPDDHFEQFLIDKGYDDKLDDYVLTSNIENVIELILYGCYSSWGGASCGGIGIKDLTGIEGFKNLEVLDVTGNYLTNLDVSQNIALISLRCERTNLDSLDVSNNLNLNNLSCSGNQISNLDLTNNIKLESLSTGYWLLPYLGNNISNLDLSKNVNLKFLDCTNNKIASLDISKCSKLGRLHIRVNNLSSLDISKNINLGKLSCTQNPLLECIQVNQDQLSFHPGFDADKGVIYSLDCNN